MRSKSIAVVALVCAAVLLPAARWGELGAQPSAALTGIVSSAQEGPMEGVIVSANAPGSTITTSVVSDNHGRYAFPATKLPPATYNLTVRAVGYDLDAPASVTLANGTATANLGLRKVRDIAFQLNDAEWVASMPGTPAEKKLLVACDSCHSVQRIVYSTYSAQEFANIIPRMNTYVNQSTAVHPQRRTTPGGGDINPRTIGALAQYLETVNLHNRSYWSYPLKGLPRPTGAATHVIYTEYALPRQTIEPHDVYMADGTVWFSEFGDQALGALDPASGKVTEYAIPSMKPGSPTGELDLEPDRTGRLWLSGMYQGGLESFDPKTRTFQLYPLSTAMNTPGAQESMVMPNNMNVDGEVWTNNQDRHLLLRLDAKTGEYTAQGPIKDPTADRLVAGYGLLSDSHNNAYLLDFGGQGVAKVDAKSGAVTMYTTPTPNSRPRRGHFFGNDQIVFAEYGGDRVGTLDTHTGTIKEYPVPAGSNPYDAIADKNGEFWAASMWTDRVDRVNPKTNAVTDYLLPHPTNIRRVFVENSTTPVTFWAGNNHGASIVKLEPLP